MNENTELYFALLRCCLAGNNNGGIPSIELLRKVSWHHLLKFSKKQGTVTIYWHGIERWFPNGDSPVDASAEEIDRVRPTAADVLEWMATIRRVELRIDEVNDRCLWITKQFREAGFRTCLLKGQGNARYYPNGMMRLPGDIDLWVEGTPRKVLNYVDSVVPGMVRTYHHVEFGQSNGVNIEVHYRPTWLNSFINNQRLQHWFGLKADEQFCHKVNLTNRQEATVCVPTYEFNLYFQLCHVYHHLLSEGIGMRHLLDYYFLLKSGGPISEQQRKNMVQQLKYFGLHRVAQSMMWVLKHVLGLADEYLIAMPSEKLGHILLHEMLEGGNLGKHDERLLSGVQPKGWKHNVQRLVRDVRMVWYFPSECLWEPAFRVYHWFWRLAHQHHH